jgi:two-component system catabolic regulation response regulator CreB/two-component system response regulator ChvI
MNDPGSRSSGGYYHHHNKSKTIFGLGSHDSKYYDQIITKLNLQTRKQHEHSLLQDQTTTARSEKNKKRVLLVDDEPDICMIYQMVLEDAGYECVSYTDPVKALQQFRPNYYDLVLLDIKMPVLNGFELCKKIREVDRTVHIVFITAAEAYYEKFRTQHYPQLGKVNYIQKPIGNDELVQIVGMIVTNSITMD